MDDEIFAHCAEARLVVRYSRARVRARVRARAVNDGAARACVHAG